MLKPTSPLLASLTMPVALVYSKASERKRSTNGSAVAVKKGFNGQVLSYRTCRKRCKRAAHCKLWCPDRDRLPYWSGLFHRSLSRSSSWSWLCSPLLGSEYSRSPWSLMSASELPRRCSRSSSCPSFPKKSLPFTKMLLDNICRGIKWALYALCQIILSIVKRLERIMITPWMQIKSNVLLYEIFLLSLSLFNVEKNNLLLFFCPIT